MSDQQSGFPVDRRTALGLGGALLATAAARPGAATAAGAAPQTVTLTEGTNIAVAPSPDGSTIAFDLLGLLWVMPSAGGAARCLTDAYADIGRPCWSPDGTRIVFQSYRSGNFHIWTIRPDGSGLEQLTDGPFDHREPCFASDGRSLLLSSDRTGRYAIHRLDLAGGGMDMLSGGDSQDSEPCAAPDGNGYAYVADGTRLMRAGWSGPASVSAAVEKSADWTRPSNLYAPAFAPDGRLAFVTIVDGLAQLHMGGKAVVSGEDIYPFRPGWLPGGDLVYASGGKVRRRSAGGDSSIIAFTAAAAVAAHAYARRRRDFASSAPRPVLGIGSPVLSPDGKRVAFRALNGIYLLTIGAAQPELLIGGPCHKCDPAWSPDGRFLSYSTDRGGTLDLWLHDFATGEERQLTNLPSAAATSGSWSPDGSRIAFLDQDGALHEVEVASGEIRRVYDALWEPGRPSYGPDGKHIAYAAFKPVSGRYREGLSEVLVVDRASGKGVYTPIAPHKSIATRGDDGPVWSPDGRHLAYVFASTLWVQPVDAAGRFTGPARQLTSEVSDAPSWSGDSSTLLYLNAGRLKLVPLHGGVPRAVPFSMTWALPRAPERVAVTGARLWDGMSPRYREADVVVEGGHVRDVAAPGTASGAGLRTIDGRGLTLMPGLIDMHTHRQMQGFGYGDRMGRVLLAMGITATRSPGCPAYHMVEDREAVDAGNRVAPRHFATGEAIDGSRIFYNFMRPVTERAQMALELERARALGYDMIKTYVRLDHRSQEAVIRAAHDMGVSVSSHYHYPALRNGSDCVEHLGATSRFGYSRTVTALGAGYEDGSKLFAAARAGRTPTLFSSNALLPDHPELVEDVRIRTLFPPWEYERLKAKADLLRAGDRRALLGMLERNVAQIKEMMALGWHVHAGTDAPIDTVGVSLHLNLRALTRFGISPYEALLTATRHAGEFLAEPLGTIAPGQLADLILVEGDPLSRLEDAARVRLVIAAGVARDMQELLAPFARSSAAIPTSHVHAEARSPAHFWETASFVERSRATCCAGHSASALA